MSQPSHHIDALQWLTREVECAKRLAREHGLRFSLVLIAAALLLPKLCSYALVDYGNHLLLRSLVQSDLSESQYPFPAVMSGSASGSQAVQLLRLAAKVDPLNKAARWGIGRAALNGGLADEAAAALPVDDQTVARDPLRYLYTMTAHSYAGHHHAVIELSKRAPAVLPVMAERVVTDSAAVAYLELARRLIDSGAESDAIGYLKEATGFRPNDIYANYYLYRDAKEMKDAKRLDIYRQRLIDFPQVADPPDDPRILDFAAAVFPQLLDDDLWGHERAQTVLSYWIWKRPASPSLKHLLEELIQHYPSDAHWYYYLGELDDRLGQSQQADENYLRAVALGPGDLPALHRVLASAPQDERSVGEDESLAASMLGVSKDEVHVGANLLDGEIVLPETQDFVNGWGYGIMGGVRDWQFAVGGDELERPGSVRIANLWWPGVDLDSNYTPYAGFSGRPVLAPSDWVMISAWFRVEGARDSGSAGVRVTSATPDREPLFAAVGLPDTRGKWMRLVVVGRVTDSLRPLLFSVASTLGVANLWIEGVEIRPVYPQVNPVNCVSSPCSRLIGVPQ